ncbi:hypothetical protein DITRI_Ditri06bG0140300 [Diplodiscus trichospermus]
MPTASSSSSLLLLQPLTFLSAASSSPTRWFHQNLNYITFKTSFKKPFNSQNFYISKRQTIPFALTESDSPKSLEPNPQTLLQEVADSFDLPSGYFSQLPRDLRLDLTDAAFDLSNGPVIDECGLELGETLLTLSRAWEQADTSTSRTLASKLPLLGSSLTDSAKSAFGRRLVAAGRRFQAMGQYGEGELQKIAKAMTAAGRLLSAYSASTATDEQPKMETRMLKFGELQVEATSEKANIGAAISFVFGILSWQIAQGIQSIPESSLEYANNNALLLAKVLENVVSDSIAVFKGSATCNFLFIHILVCLHYSRTYLTWKTTEVRGKVTLNLSCLNFSCKLARQILFRQLQTAASIIKNGMKDQELSDPTCFRLSLAELSSGTDHMPLQAEEDCFRDSKPDFSQILLLMDHDELIHIKILQFVKRPSDSVNETIDHQRCCHNLILEFVKRPSDSVTGTTGQPKMLSQSGEA